METKNIYEAPEASVVELAAEGTCCLVQSGTPSGGGGIDDLIDSAEDLFN